MAAFLPQASPPFADLAAANADATARIAVGSDPLSPVNYGSGASLVTLAWDKDAGEYKPIPFDSTGSGAYLIRFVDPVDASVVDRWMDIGQVISPPAQAAHDGLVATGWGGASGANLIVTGDATFVGVYETADGWSHFEIVVNSITGLATTFFATKSDGSTLSLDWGDGSAIVTSTETGNISLSRTYVAAGNYCVRVKITTGTGTWTPGNGTSATPIFGNGAIWQLKRVVLNADVVTIQAHGMMDQQGADYIVAPYVTTAGASAFLSWYACQSASFPALTTAGTSAFQYWCSCQSASFPALTTIAASCFANNRAAHRYYFGATTPPTLADANAFASIAADCEIRVPAANLADYQAATNWSVYAAYMVGV